MAYDDVPPPHRDDVKEMDSAEYVMMRVCWEMIPNVQEVP